MAACMHITDVMLCPNSEALSRMHACMQVHMQNNDAILGYITYSH